MTIKDVIFAVESMAHLQGKERELLPIVEAARKEHEALLECAATLESLYQIYIPFGSGDYIRIVEALDKLKE